MPIEIWFNPHASLRALVELLDDVEGHRALVIGGDAAVLAAVRAGLPSASIDHAFTAATAPRADHDVIIRVGDASSGPIASWATPPPPPARAWLPPLPGPFGRILG